MSCSLLSIETETVLIERLICGCRYLNKAYYARIERGVQNPGGWTLRFRVPSAFVVSRKMRARA